MARNKISPGNVTTNVLVQMSVPMKTKLHTIAKSRGLAVNELIRQLIRKEIKAESVGITLDKAI